MITNLSIGKYGRFANMLFQIAAVVGIARKSSQDYGFLPPYNHDHKERFGSTEECDLEKMFVNSFPRLLQGVQFAPRAYSWGYHDIFLPAGHWDISGHFQSDKYFLHCLPEVRQLLTLKCEPDEYLPQVAIHVRRGDYDNVYHPRIGREYYDRARGQFPAETQFLVFSDDIQEARQMLGDDHTTYREGAPYYWDFAVMKKCSGFITANSSFSLMAAILSDAPGKKVICPRTWFGPAWTPTTADLYPRNSIVL